MRNMRVMGAVLKKRGNGGLLEETTSSPKKRLRPTENPEGPSLSRCLILSPFVKRGRRDFESPIL
jgi:hypothetical protein